MQILTSLSSSSSPIGLNIHWVTAWLVPTPNSRAVSKIDARNNDSRFSTGRCRGIGVEDGFMENMEDTENWEEGKGG